jgi:hypothetical protein
MAKSRNSIVLTLVGMPIPASPLARLNLEPGYAARNQAWFDRLAKRNEAFWPAERQAMLEAAQRAENMCDTVIGRLTK